MYVCMHHSNVNTLCRYFVFRILDRNATTILNVSKRLERELNARPSDAWRTRPNLISAKGID